VKSGMTGRSQNSMVCVRGDKVCLEQNRHQDACGNLVGHPFSPLCL